MKKNHRIKLVLASVMILIFCSLSHGQEHEQGQNKNGNRGEHPRPPKEALDACESKSDGNECHFQGREKETITGTCFRPETHLPLACRPTSPPKGSRN
jgi:hypothetical protein